MRREFDLADRIFGVSDQELVVIDHLALFHAACAGRDEVKKFSGHPDLVVTAFLLPGRCLGQALAVSADSAHEAGRAVPQNLGWDSIEVWRQFRVLEL